MNKYQSARVSYSNFFNLMVLVANDLRKRYEISIFSRVFRNMVLGNSYGRIKGLFLSIGKESMGFHSSLIICFIS